MIMTINFTSGYVDEEGFHAISTTFERNENEDIETCLNRMLKQYGLYTKGHPSEGYHTYDYFRVGKMGQEVNPYQGGSGPTVTPIYEELFYHTRLTNDEFARRLNTYIETHSKSKNE